jgi:polyribonucleotide nucleotidyltransferase
MSQIGTTQTISMADGKQITIETGKLAKQADGSVVVRMGDTMLLATVVANKEIREGQGFFPLSVDYKEKYAAAGKFPGGFFKREARPNDTEVLTCRLVDRALRPLFPGDYLAETQVMIQLISAEEDVMPDALACLAASAALSVSDIPFAGPVSEVRVARIENQWVINPSISQLAGADLDMIIAATMDNVMMVEGEMTECSEADMLEAIKVAHTAIKIQCQAQVELASKIEKSKVKREYEKPAQNEAFLEEVKTALFEKFYAIAKSGNPDKHARKSAFKATADEYKESLSEEVLSENGHLLGGYIGKVEKEAVRTAVLKDRIRLDGRATTDIRPIWCEIDYLPGAHGSAIFTRGETQSLTTCTLGSKLDQQTIDGAIISRSDDFYLHYNFPPFCTGEARPNRGTSRREVGHGNLALRALKPMIPGKELNPYTVRLVSEILESNGSSSMATVCAGTLALMDAGVQLKKPVSGIAMGLIANEQGEYAVLSDILGDEDHLGDMDFKVTGTKDGITACQMDIKIAGLSYEVLESALNQAREGRLHILNKITETIAEPRKEPKAHAPRMEQLTVAQEFIGAIIGPGGKNIQELQKATGTTITIEEIDEKGSVQISGTNAEGVAAAVKHIKELTTVPEVGETYNGVVKNVVDFGAFIEIMPGKQGLLHISEISWERTDKVANVLKENQEIEVKLVGFEKGKMKLSRKALLPRPERKTVEPKAE